MKPSREILPNQKVVLSEVARLRDCIREAMLQESRSMWLDLILEVFRFQAESNPVYQKYVHLMGVDVSRIQRIEDIPFLPVELFQRHRISVFRSKDQDANCFMSSGTTGSTPSQHPIDDLAWYDELAAAGFERLVTSWKNQPHFVGLLPGYLERNNSSLVHMMQSFMRKAGQTQPEDWFFLHDFEALEKRLLKKYDEGHPPDQPIFIVGVTHALLKLADRVKRQVSRPAWLKLPLYVIETGGMKGQGKEQIRAEVHKVLAVLSEGRAIGSEYGMTELLSQAWSGGAGIFSCPPWMEVRMGALNDPKGWVSPGKQGRIHVVDLANVSTCAFLATSDIGRCFEDGSFEVLGRFDHADVRGCNLMAID